MNEIVELCELSFAGDQSKIFVFDYDESMHIVLRDN